MKYTRPLFSFLFAFLFVTTGFSQQTGESPLSYKGDLRLLHFGNDTNTLGIKGPNSFRLRFAATYTLNESNRFNTRLAGSLSENGEPVRFSLVSDQKKLALGGISFDTFNYQFNRSGTELKIGRFQHNVVLQSVSRRSNFKLQSNVNNIHWTDGIYFKQYLAKGWFTEAVAEYQHRDYLTYNYKGGLNFQNNIHNVAGFLNLETRERDRFNFIQKGFSVFYAPDAFDVTGEYRDYVAVMSRLAYDLPRPGLLQGGSFRLSAELGQNMNVGLSEGSNASFSVGINNFAGRHKFITEIAKTDAHWLTPSVYSPSSDEIEFRYTFAATDNLLLCMRYRIRDSRIVEVPTAYSTFFRATIKF